MTKSRKVLIGVILGMTMLAAPLLVLGANVPDITDNSGSVTINAYVPHVSLVELQEGLAADDAFRGTSLGTDLTDTQLDVHDGGLPHSYGFLIEVNMGDVSLVVDESDITDVTLMFYYDMNRQNLGIETQSFNLGGANTQNVRLDIDMATDTATLVKPVAGDEIFFDPLVTMNFDVRHGIRADNITVNNHYATIWVRFGFCPWMRWAPGNGPFNAPAVNPHIRDSTYNDLNSWNYVVTAEDTYGTSESWFGEFGTFKYQSASFANIDVAGSGAPGSPTFQLTQGGLNPTGTFQCNAPHKVTVALQGDPGPASDLTQADLALSGGDETLAGTPFVDGAAPSTIIVTGNAARFRLVMNQTDDPQGFFDIGITNTWWRTTPDIIWSVTIPMGVPEGVYSQAVTYGILTSGAATPINGATPYGTPLP